MPSELNLRRCLVILLIASVAGCQADDDIPSKTAKQAMEREGQANPLDADDDELDDRVDPCLHSVHVGDFVSPGCTVADLVRRPDQLTRALTTDIARTRKRLTRHEQLVTLDEMLGGVSFAESHQHLRQAEMCEAASSWSELLPVLAEIGEAIEIEVEHLRESAVVVDGLEYPNNYRVLSDTNAVLAELELMIESQRDIGRLLDSLCEQEQSEPETAEATIRNFDSATSLLHLSDGERVVVPSNIDFEEAGLFPGHQGTGTYKWVSGAGILTDAQFEPGMTGPGLLGVPACMRIDVVPAQPSYSPLFPVVPVRHELLGYKGTNYYQLETGMKLAFDDSECEPALTMEGPLVTALKRTADIGLTYEGPNGPKTAMLAVDLGSSDAGVAFPADLVPYEASLAGVFGSMIEVEFYEQTCTFNTYLPPEIATACTARKHVRTETYNLQIRARGSNCNVSMNDDVLSLQDSDLINSYIWTYANWPTASLFPMTSPVGLVIDDLRFFTRKNLQQSIVALNSWGPLTHGTFFSPAYILNNWEFASFDGATSIESELFGVNKAAGVAWPSMVGTRNGSPFQYVCSVEEKVVRDRVGECSSIDSFYILPFGEADEVTVSQGNQSTGSGSHQGYQSFAFDLTSDEGADALVIAARGGIVDSVSTTTTGNCADFNCCAYDSVPDDDDPCPMGFDAGGQNVMVRHQDGTLGWYAHLAVSSIVVQVGQVVHRGDPIGAIGDTGRSKGPHLHFQVENEARTSTIPIRIEHNAQSWCGQLDSYYGVSCSDRWCTNLEKGDCVLPTGPAHVGTSIHGNSPHSIDSVY